MPVQLTIYVQNQKRKNIPDDLIKQTLYNAGYQREQIESVFLEVSTGSSSDTKVQESDINSKEPIFDAFINKVVGLEFNTFKIIVLLAVSYIVIALLLSLNYYLFIANIIFQYKNNYNKIFTDGTPFIFEFFSSYALVLVLLSITLLIIMVINILYLMLIKFVFLKDIRLRSILTSYSIYSFVPSLFILISIIYNFIFIKMINGWSVIALMFFPVIGFIIQYILLAESFSKMGCTKFKSYFVLIVPWLVLFTIIIIDIILLSPIPYKLIWGSVM